MNDITTDFDEIAKWYDAPFNQVYFKILYKKAIAFIDKYIKTGDKFLDIGCGTGNWLVMLESSYQLDLYGLDNSQGMLDRVKSKSSKINLTKGGAESLPYGNEVFDFISIVESFHHFTDHKLALQEAQRVLRSRGYVFLLDPTLNGLAKIVWLGSKILKFERKSKYFYFADVSKLIEESGFVIVESRIEFGNNWILAQKP